MSNITTWAFILLQEEYPKFKNSYLKISSYEFSTTVPMIVLNDIEFYYSNWAFYDVDISMTDCNTSFLLLNINSCGRNSNLTNFTSTVNIQNCTLGCWKFRCIKAMHITDCSIKGTPPCNSKLIMDLIKSSATLENIFIHSVNLKCTAIQLCGFVVDYSSTAQIQNLIYEKNKRSPILVQRGSNLLMENCTILDNDVRSGVIYGASDSVVDITNCRIENNTAHAELGIVYVRWDSAVMVSGSTFSGNHGSGVVVEVSSTLDISNSTFTNNRATAGGSVSVRLDSNLTISLSIFDGNTASMLGGAIFIDESNSAFCTSSSFIGNRAGINGGAIAVQRSNVTLSHLIIDLNLSHGVGAVSAVYNLQLDVRNCTFNKNTEVALFATGNIRLTVRNSDFFHNEAKDGGAMLIQFSKNVTLSHLRLFHNVATINGGAIASYYNNLYIDSSIFQDNVAFYDSASVRKTHSVGFRSSDFGSGGALYIHSGSLFMSNSIAKHNYAVIGGAIQGQNSDINLTNCFFESNTADFNGGAVSITNSSLRVDNVIYKNNTLSSSSEMGAAAISADRCRVYISNSLFSENNALVSAGAIHISADVLHLFNTTFSNNSAGFAGALEATNMVKIQLTDCVFVNNSARDGAVITVERSALLGINSIFEGNVGGRSSSDSSCLFLSNSEASFENCTFERNINNGEYEGEGGAITSKQCQLRISMSIFDGNEAYLGKDIFLENDMLTYLSLFKHSTTLESNDTNFKQKAFQENILGSDHPDEVMINESQYASGKNLLQFVIS